MYNLTRPNEVDIRSDPSLKIKMACLDIYLHYSKIPALAAIICTIRKMSALF